jgi:hypothetical protein
MEMRYGYQNRKKHAERYTDEELAGMREEIRTVWCPFCDAQPGEKCLGVLRQNGEHRNRITNHVDRMYYYRAMQVKRGVDPKKAKDLAWESSRKNIADADEESSSMPVMKKSTAKKAVTKGKTAPKGKTSSSSPSTPVEAPVKRPVGRPRKNPLPVEPPKPVFRLLDPEADGKLRIAGMSYTQLAELTGIAVDTEAFLIMREVLRGGRDRQEINDRVREILPATTAQGTPKPVPNLVSSVVKKLQDKGFTIKGDWKMVKPARSA